MKVTIGIPTYNRKGIIEIMAKSLYESNLPETCNIRIYDDSSFEYSKDYLYKLFPTAASIIVNSVNLKADENMFSMYKDFLLSEDDCFFNADSDFIFNKQWLLNGLKLLPYTDGVLSIFNANSHPIKKHIDKDLSIKNNIGAAGTFFTRERVLDIVTEFENAKDLKSFDWQWSKFLTNRGVRLFCVNNSLIQHIGHSGQNSRSYFDVGLGFKIETKYQGQVVNDIFVKSIDNVRTIERERIINFEAKHAKQSNDFLYHLKRCCIIIIKSIFPRRKK